MTSEEIQEIDKDLSQQYNDEEYVMETPPKPTLLERIAKIISAMFSPLLAPTYGVLIALNLTTIAPYSVPTVRIWVTLAILAITCMIPVSTIALLYKLGKISDPGVNQQKDRLIPYLITVISYMIGAVYLVKVNSPQWIPMFMVGGGIAAIASALINLKWKISAHGAGMGGLVALVFSIWTNGYGLVDFLPVATIVILLAGIVGTSRLILNCHTLGQVLAGTLNGFFWVFLLTI